MESENEALPLPKIDAVFKTKNGAKWDAWKVLEFRVHEQLAFPYNGTVDVVAPSKGVSFKDLLGKSCVLVLTRGANHKRFFKGLVHRVEQSMDPGNVRAQIGFAPALWALQHGKDSRVFEDATAPQIIEEVANEALEPFERTIRLSLTRSYAKREICTQYQESDWNFILRLMVDEGIFFYFDEGKEESDPETAVFVDSNDSCPYIDTMSPVRAPTRPAPTPVQPSTWIGVSVVWDDSGEPVADLPVVIEPPRGGSTMKATRSDGSVRVDPIDPGPSEVRCRFSGLKYSECVEFVGVGDGPPATRERGAAATKSSPQGDGPRAIVKVTRRRVRANDTLESIAREEGIPRKDLATFNWGTDGADGKDDTGKAVFTGETRPGTILIPKLWRLPGLAGARVHTIRVRPIPERLQLKFHLHYDLKAPHAEDDIIILETEDGGWRQKVPVASLAEVEPHYVEAVFFDPPMDGRFNLLKDLNDGSEPQYIFAGIPYRDLLGHVDGQEDKDA